MAPTYSEPVYTVLDVASLPLASKAHNTQTRTGFTPIHHTLISELDMSPFFHTQSNPIQSTDGSNPCQTLRNVEVPMRKF